MPKGVKREKYLGFLDVEVHIGDAANAVKRAPVKIEQTYRMPNENHHPMEPHASIAEWQGEKLTMHDSTQGVKGSQGITAYLLNLKPENVRIFSPFVGGGFGCKGLQWMNPTLTAMAAQAVKRPVKLGFDQTDDGHKCRATRCDRAENFAGSRQKRTALRRFRHLTDTYTNNSEFFEPCGLPTETLYAAPNREITHTVTQLNIGAPTTMRAPGESSGTFALESAMDELAFELKIDPVELSHHQSRRR